MRAFHIPNAELSEMYDACFYGYAVLSRVAADQPGEIAQTYHATAQRLRQIGGILMRVQMEGAPLALIAGVAEVPDQPLDVQPVPPLEMAVAA